MLRTIFQRFWQKPHLRGLTPIDKPVNYYWQRVWSMDNLQEAYAWLCEQNDDTCWDYRGQWDKRRFELQHLLRSEQFSFQPVQIVEVENEQGEMEQRELRCAEDRLVIQAMAQVLNPVFHSYLSSSCTHLKGNGGIKQAVHDTQLFLATHPDAQVFKSDVKSYYANIEHSILSEQLHFCLPNEVALHQMIWQFMHRTTEFGGNYNNVERGLSLGASLSPLFGAVHLAPLDALGDSLKTGFYRRHMDDWVMVVPKKQQLHKLIKNNYTVLQALRLRVHPDKTFIGKVSKGFDFLGFHCSPTCLRVSQTVLSWRDKKIARLYEQGTNSKRIAQYLARWFGWATFCGVIKVSYAVPCVTAHGSGEFESFIDNGLRTEIICQCQDGERQRISFYKNSIYIPDQGDSFIEFFCQNINARGGHDLVNGISSLCQEAEPKKHSDVLLAANKRYYFKNTSEDNDYYSCTTDSQGLFTKNAEIGLKKCDDGSIQAVCPAPASTPTEVIRPVAANPPPQPDYYQLSVAGSLAHIKSSPSGIDCEYGEGSCSKMFDRGATVKLELVNLKTTEGLTKDDYDIEWFGDSDCNDQVVTMHDMKRCAVRVYGKQDVDYSPKTASNTTVTIGQLDFLNFSGHGMLRGGAEDVILGFILEGTGTADIMLHADIIDQGVLPKFDLNQVLHDEAKGYYGKMLDQQESSESFTFNKTIQAGIYTIQLSSNGLKGRGMAGISLKNNTLNLTNLSVRGHLQQPLVFNFIVNGTGSQKATISSSILEGKVETQMTLINLATGQSISSNAGFTNGTTVDIVAGSYAVVLETLTGQGVGMIEIDLVE